MAIKYLATGRLQGTTAERTALTTTSGGWTQGGSNTITMDTSSPFTIRNNGGNYAPHGLSSVVGANGSNTSGNTKSYLWKALGFTLDNTNWVASCIWKRTTISVDNSGNCVLGTGGHSFSDCRPMGFTSESTYAMAESDGNSGSHGLSLYGDTNWNLSKKYQGTHGAQGHVNGLGTTSDDETRYVVLARTSTTNLQMRVYTNSAFSTLDSVACSNCSAGAGIVDYTIESGIQDLDIIQCGNTTNNISETSQMHGFETTDIKVWDDTTSDYASGWISALGTPDFTAGLTFTYPNAPNGGIFEESDGTGKQYMWDGTSAWNEIT